MPESAAPPIRVVVWNAEWNSATSKKGRRIRSLHEEVSPDIICLTEGFAGLLPAEGQVIRSGSDYGYPQQEGRRKVLLWSRYCWRNVDSLGDPSLPPGRFISGITDTPAGGLKVIGVCIPWKFAHVTDGKKKRRLWEDHLSYLEGLRRILQRGSELPVIVAGDFNQRIPRKWTPVKVHEALLRTFEGLTFATAGKIDGLDRQLIDHLAYSPGRSVRNVHGIDGVAPDGLQLSDHDGAVVELISNS